MRTSQELNSLATKTRKILGEDGYSPIDIFALIDGWKEKKMTIVRYPLSGRISGMCIRVGEDTVIVINSKASYGRQRFALAHELYHMLFEEGMRRVICEMNVGSGKSDSEKEADRFASYLLMPYDSFSEYSERVGEWDDEKIIEAEQFFQISHMSMIFRLRMDKQISIEQAAQFQNVPVSRKAAALGFDEKLYLPLPEDRQFFTTGEYIRKVEKYAENNYISGGEKEDLLLDAFRTDIVYHMEDDGEVND